MKINNSAIYFMLVFILISAGIIIFTKPRQSPNCNWHKELFFDEIRSGVIINKFIDYDNHAIKMVELKAKNKTYKILFIPSDNMADFESIKIGDTVSKPIKSFQFTLNRGYKFQLKYNCAYTKTDSLKD